MSKRNGTALLNSLGNEGTEIYRVTGKWSKTMAAGNICVDKTCRSWETVCSIGKKALVITWASEKFDFFLVGTCFEAETDHKPVVKLLGESDSANLPCLCQNFKLRLLRYNFDIFHTPENLISLTDLLSRRQENKHREKEHEWTV